jgi:hypothetical protein
MKDLNELKPDRPPHQSRWRTLRSQIALWWDVLKYPALFLAAFILVTRYGQGAWVELFKAGVSIALSIAMMGYIAYEIWRNRRRLHLVTQVYLRSGILTYVRAVLIFIATTTTTLIAWQIVPDFMRYGWTDFVFGYSTNVAFQPVVTIDQVSRTQSQSGFPFAYVGALLAILFWLVMILALPFLAEIEERVFRQGIHTWKAISRSSLVFGLIHLIMGIPLFMGFVLFVPGFLFACRYKYAYHRHLKQFDQELAAQEVGVQASTADHAVYNALLVTGLTAALLLIR